MVTRQRKQPMEDAEPGLMLAQEEGAPRAQRRWLVMSAMLVILFAVAWGVVLFRSPSPADDSADAGFARDMSRHHAQAVQMASSVYRRTTDPLLQTMAYDILTTQQAQVGMMSAWLSDRDLSGASSQLPMTWMGQPTTGLMPGMATNDDVASLDTFPSAQADAQFLRLMIRHHAGGVAMAQAEIALGDDDFLLSLAHAIVVGQQAEITQMQGMLAQRGLPAEDVSALMSASMAGIEMGHGGMADEAGGFTTGFGAALRRALRFLPFSIGVFALGWLLAALFRDVPGEPLNRIDWPPLRWIAVGGLFGSAVLHAALTPEHFREHQSYGVFFAAATIAAAFLSGVIAAHPWRWACLAGAALALGLIALWALFRLVPPPLADEKEAIDLTGVATKVVELVAALSLLALWARMRRHDGIAQTAR